MGKLQMSTCIQKGKTKRKEKKVEDVNSSVGLPWFFWWLLLHQQVNAGSWQRRLDFAQHSASVWFPGLLSLCLWVGGLSGPEVSSVPWFILTLLSPLPPVLFAMKEDNEKVPTLLTDYILKGKSSPDLWEQKWPPRLPSPRTLAGWMLRAHTVGLPEPLHWARPGRAGELCGQLWAGPCLWMLLGGLRRTFHHPRVTRATPHEEQPNQYKGLLWQFCGAWAV